MPVRRHRQKQPNAHLPLRAGLEDGLARQSHRRSPWQKKKTSICRIFLMSRNLTPRRRPQICRPRCLRNPHKLPKVLGRLGPGSDRGGALQVLQRLQKGLPPTNLRKPRQQTHQQSREAKRTSSWRMHRLHPRRLRASLLLDQPGLFGPGTLDQRPRISPKLRNKESWP